MYDVIIIGCGIVGAAAAYELSRYQLKVLVLEKENDVADGTTKANSAILHAGYDPEPGTWMAKLNVEGVKLAKQLCADLDVPYRQCGSLVLALSPEELPTLELLRERGEKNGVEGLRILDSREVRELEPNLGGEVCGALLAPSAAICNPWEFALALIETAVRNGVELRRSSAVTGIERTGNGWLVHSGTGSYPARTVLNAAGVHADSVHDMAAPHAFTILPKRGQYYLLDKCEGTRTNHVTFQCPTARGKGVLVAPTVHGNLIVGPSAENIDDADDVSTTAEGMRGVAEAARRSIPSIQFRECIRSFAGVRAASDQEDFIIGEAEGAPGFIDLAGIKSPGLSAAPAIAKMAAELLRGTGMELVGKKEFISTRKRVRFHELPAEEKARLVQQNPLYGRIVCRCETITEGEILDALHSPVPPVSVDGVKRRANAGMGRCQGGFCGPRVLEILARERGVSPLEIEQDKQGSRILLCESKTGELE